jgi:hypothetical protein
MAKKSNSDIVADPEKSQAGDDSTPNKASEQLLIPNFENLSQSEHTITPGAKLPGDNVGGQDAEQLRGPGRPRMTDPEREAAKERKRERDRGRRKGGKTSSTKVASGDDVTAAIAASNAAMVCHMLDLLAAGISAGEYVPPAQMQLASNQAWTAYLIEEGITLPGWVQVLFVSCAHVLPAFSSETGKGRISRTWSKVKGWFVSRGH